ncbi:hypothetical protein E4P40_16065 [Blastococcus sp. CT_GayMR20]|uniref:hypothetical protein n=1 Tax=Blastococcus sp. CT_GayMR20 TaxID=2559609 RepID=UPI001072FA1F|nr:hypothetical protein [Blastococcus sp. CT_GayMR20]TFV81362.1 hypothetical protein E4P40_16000 [Blastococcus sp. CT_GayMR20]TFV81373.1 hypothetical protein E4P40_16065 [Blastococcus sp. CT_GayMR20]
MQRRPAEPSGDYEYDLVHEPFVDRQRPPSQPHPEHPSPAPARRPAELDGDMSYDEAHDF